MNYLSSTFDQSGQVDSVYTDFAKAFDRVDHTILSIKAEHLGIHGSLLRWLHSYLLNRTQLVTVSGYGSSPFIADSGVPQGSNLGPLLFLMFINDLLNKFKCECLAFADDIKIYRRIYTSDDCAALQSDIDILTRWCDENNMSLSIEKCQVITFTKKRNFVPSSYMIHGVQLNRVDVVRDLGVWFDSKLSFKAHYDAIISKARRMMAFLYRISKPFKQISSMITLYTSLVRSLLEYSCVIWSPLYANHINRIESIQKQFVRSLAAKFGLRKTLLNYTDRLKRFNLDTLYVRRQVSDLLILYKMVNSKMDATILSHVSLKVTRRSNRKQHLFVVPSTKNNVSYNNPLVRFCRQYNLLSKELDIFYQNPSTFVKTIKDPDNLRVLANNMDV